eukprot:m.450522 g.450522  ORF g.450522 m.450522 type:complete len:53 (-) comp21512_c0_seq25:2389-2547(-)
MCDEVRAMNTGAVLFSWFTGGVMLDVHLGQALVMVFAKLWCLPKDVINFSIA